MVPVLGPAGPGLSTPAVAASARPAEIIVRPGHLGTISKYLFGANLIWADDAEGAFDAATSSFYPGFVRMLRRLGVTALRYPGGTTSDSFDWERAIGPQRDRRANEPYGMQAAQLSAICCVLDGPQSSTVGPDEFGRLLDQTGAVGTITVNFATGTAREAADFVAYMTAPESTHPSSDPGEPSYWAALRAKDGHPAPYDVPYWEVGNEQVFPGQYGWRSGRVVSIGRHAVRCPEGQVATCLYAFGGTTSFSGQRVGTFADELPSASYSTGAPHQTFYVYFPPVLPGRAQVYVAGRRWAEVDDLATAGPKARVYTLVPSTGAIEFGDGVHGQVPPAGAQITASYESGPHGGFVQFYEAMKRMNPHISICESEETNVAFLQVMGQRYPYDCVELHEYARPADIAAPLTQYEEGLMAFPARQGAQLAKLQTEVRRYAGRDVPVFMTEYGQLVAPVPVADPEFNLSLEEGLLIGAQLVEWTEHNVTVAEKYLVDSDPFIPNSRTTTFNTDRVVVKVRLNNARTTVEAALSFGKAMVETGLSPDNAMVVHRGGQFVAEPTGEVLGLMGRLAGGERLAVSVVRDGRAGPGRGAPELWAVAAISPARRLDLLVINASPHRSMPEEVVLDGPWYPGRLNAYVLDGPSPTAFNTRAHPEVVRTTSSVVAVGRRSFHWTFPAHSVTLLQLASNAPVEATARTDS
jgi:alpha-N-arabinofuranosidase